MNNIKIGPKLISAFLAVVVLTVALGMHLINAMNGINQRDGELYERGTVPLGEMAILAANSQKFRMYARAYLIARSPAEIEKLAGEADEMEEKIDAGIDKQVEMATSDEGRKILESYRESVKDYADGLKQNLELVRNGNKDGAIDRLQSGSFAEAAKEMEKRLDVCVERKLQIAKGLAESNDASANSATRVATILLVVVALISLALGILLTRSLTGPLSIVVNTLSKMEKGDLTARASIHRGDELGLLANALDSLAGKLQSILKGLRVNSDTLAGASEELSAVARQLASGSEETVNQTVTVSSTTEQMSSNINAMASAAEEASVNANEVAGAAEQMSANMNAVSSGRNECQHRPDRPECERSARSGGCGLGKSERSYRIYGKAGRSRP